MKTDLAPLARAIERASELASERASDRSNGRRMRVRYVQKYK